jgi:drug/metabolite transporter (DMT)-like permease
LLFRKRQPLSVWIGVVIALGGLYLLCMGDGESISNSDVFLLLCALAFTAHILVIDRFSPHVDGIALSCVQFAVVAVWSSIGMLLTEQPTLEGIMACIGPILYVGLMSSGIAYTLQILAQKGSNSAVVSLLLCMESVFASIAEALMHGTWMSGRETIGAALMLTAVILAQIPREAWGRVFKKVK